MIPAAALKRLKDAAWLAQPEVQRLFALLDGAQGSTRAVGGVVRDTLLDVLREAPEIDFATTLTPTEVSRRAGEAGIAVYPTGIEHGTVTLGLGDTTIEVTTLREDVETDGRHAVVRFGTDWARDAERRDFTLNALYCGMDGTLFDPLGGAEDCLAGRIRFIGDPDRRIAEDRLRVYRFFRFSTSHGRQEFDAEGLAAVTRAAGTLGELSAERVGSEMRRMLGLPKMASTLSEMVEAGVLDLPLALVEQLAAYERHVRKANFGARLALLVAGVGAETLKRRWRLSNDDIGLAETIIAAAKLLSDFHLNEAAYRYPAALADAVEVAATLKGWTEAGKAAVVDRLEGLEVPRFPLGGGVLIEHGMKPGPALGAELERLEKLWIASDFRLDREALIQLMRP